MRGSAAAASNQPLDATSLPAVPPDSGRCACCKNTSGLLCWKLKAGSATAAHRASADTVLYTFVSVSLLTALATEALCFAALAHCVFAHLVRCSSLGQPSHVLQILVPLLQQLGLLIVGQLRRLHELRGRQVG